MTPRTAHRPALLLPSGLAVALALAFSACDAVDSVDAVTSAETSLGLTSDAPAPAGGDTPICVFQIVGTSNAKGNGDVSRTANVPHDEAVMWTPEEGAQALDDPAFGNLEGSMWPAFADGFYDVSGCVPFLGSTADGGGRITALSIPESCEPWDPQNNIINHWHPDCEGMFDLAVEESHATHQAALDLYPNRTVVFGGWLTNFGNDQIDVDNGLFTSDDYATSLGQFYEAFGAEFPGAHAYYIQSVNFKRYLTEPDWQTMWRNFSLDEERACTESDVCVVAAQESMTVIEQYAACPTIRCNAAYYADDHHWNWKGLNYVGRTAGEAVGAYFTDL